jgi:hypothetical protein
MTNDANTDLPRPRTESSDALSTLKREMVINAITKIEEGTTQKLHPSSCSSSSKEEQQPPLRKQPPPTKSSG